MLSFQIFVSFWLLLLVNQAFTTQKKYRTLFQNFIETHNKFYESAVEHEYRFNIFVENMKRAKQLQRRNKGTAKYGVTKFADLTVPEFQSKYTGLKAGPHPNLPEADIPDIHIPDNFDWRDSNVVTAVKNQGKCGSCWAFSTTGNIESLYAIKYNKLLSLSEQELVDCDSSNYGCSGGSVVNAYFSIISLGGLETESDYTYTGSDDNCKLNKSKVAVTISGAVQISSNEAYMAYCLYIRAPLSIAINAADMQLYQGGISYPSKSDCDPNNLNHAVLIVGYGVQKKIPYWIIKNSWGTSWGEKGYYRVYRGAGICGLNTIVTSATL